MRDRKGVAQKQNDVIRKVCTLVLFVFFQAEDGIRDLVRSRGLGDVYKRQVIHDNNDNRPSIPLGFRFCTCGYFLGVVQRENYFCLLYTSDAADERSSVDLGGRRIIKKKTMV